MRTEKACAGCHEVKPPVEFHRKSENQDGRQSWCKVCQGKYSRVWGARIHPTLGCSNSAARNRARRARMDSTAIVRVKLCTSMETAKRTGCIPCTTPLDVIVKGYNDGTCFICEKVIGRSVHLDHDHRTGEFRGFLCHHCNSLLGFAGDDPEILRRALDYLSIEMDYTKGATQRAYSAHMQVVRRRLRVSRHRAKLKGYAPCLTPLVMIVGHYDGGCRICSRKGGISLYLDHCHKTGKFRGFLCRRCNSLLGFARDDPELLLRAIDYLEL